MELRFWETDLYYRISINNYEPVVKYSFENENPLTEMPSILKTNQFEVNSSDNKIKISIKLDVTAHILGLGERAFGIDRKRRRLISVNTDPGGYTRGKDPIYLPIPFFLQITDGKGFGVFVNHPGEVIFDFGIDTYDRSIIEIEDCAAEIFVFKSDQVDKVVQSYFALTGKPILPPKWAIGHSISRYTYYPSETVIDVLKKYSNTVRVDAIYLDIHYMDDYKLFTWNKERFGDGRAIIESIHNLGAKVITIIDPSIKSDQNYKVYRDGIGHYMETANGEIYHGNMWPGDSVFPDFLNEGGREFWKKHIKEWIATGVDGIWLDMNEPTILTESHLIEYESIHHTDNGKPIQHGKVRNAYPYFQAMATFEAMKEVDSLPFILSRSGYSGIQKYAAIWTGDNNSSWDDLKLQISLVTSLSISGIPVVGCDLGGFFSDSDPEMLSAYYRMALFFPLYRNHKTINGNDQEIFLMPSKYREDIIETVRLRYDFLDYIYSILYNSHIDGIPTVTPLAYNFPGDNDSFYVEDQYMVGQSLLYAPTISKGKTTREVYLPAGKWINFWSEKAEFGPKYIESSEKYPIFMRENSCCIYQKNIVVFGKGTFRLYIDSKEVIVQSDGKNIRVSPKIEGYNVVLKNTS